MYLYIYIIYVYTHYIYGSEFKIYFPEIINERSDYFCNFGRFNHN